MSTLDEKLRQTLQSPRTDSLGATVISFPTDHTLEQIKQAFIDEGWSKPPRAQGKSDVERILAVKREADINEVRLLAIATPMYTTKELIATQLGTTYGIDHVIGMVHQPLYYKMLDAKRGVMTGQEWYDKFREEVNKDMLDKPYENIIDQPVRIIDAAKRASGLEDK